MLHFVAVPLIGLIVTTVLAGRALDRLAPAAAARWNGVLILAVIVAVVPTFWMLGLSGLAHVGVRSTGVNVVPLVPPGGLMMVVVAVTVKLSTWIAFPPPNPR